MTNIDIFSGFLGAGKTTLIKKLIADGYNGQKLVIIENEFGQIGIDGGFLKESGIQITEMNSGCICCSLVGDFGKALHDVIEQYNPDRIIIEPSGVGKLSDVISAVVKCEGTNVCGKTAVIDAKKAKIYLKNFKEFYENQIANASTICLSRTSDIKQEKLNEAISLIKEINPEAAIITTPWDKLSGEQILKAIYAPLNSGADDMAKEMLEEHQCCHDHEHHHHEHDENCSCGCHNHEHHHHEHDENCSCGCHGHGHHHHEHDENCSCGCHDHEHHHHHEHNHEHHHADEIFTSLGFETSKAFPEDFINNALTQLDNDDKFGTILRAKGIVASENDNWIHFDYVPEEKNIRIGSADITGKLCIIGSNVNEVAIKELFGIN